MTPRTLVLPCLLLLAGCAAHASREAASAASASEAPAQAVVRADAGDDFAALVAEQEALDAVLLGTPDCERACSHLTSLCELSERICALAAQEPAPELEARCTDGRTRCEQARVRSAAVCICQP